MKNGRASPPRLYQEVRIPLYWTVDPDGRQVEVWTPELRFPRVERERVVWDAEGAGEPLKIGLEELLRPI